MSPRLVVASNRGPLSFTLDDRGEPVPGPPAGGLAATLLPLLRGTEASWVSSTMSEADRKAAAAGLMVDDGIRMSVVEPDPDTYRLAYDVVANATLWFVHHHLFDSVRRPRLDHRFAEAWDAYRRFNASFAELIAGEADDGATVLVQDYHLTLLPRMLAAPRPDLRVLHFSHTPFADPGVFRILPTGVRRELLEGMAGARACGFHTARWEAAFRACCADAGLDPPQTFRSPLAPDVDELAQRIAAPPVSESASRLEEVVGDRLLLVRVDRIEPAKNLLRGFWAFDELLAARPEWRERVVLLSLGYPSRQSLPEYLAYTSEVELAARRVNDRWATEGWTPILLDVVDDSDRSLAALLRYDALLVNSLRDGLNLVAKEGPVVNRRDGALLLSTETGAFDELHGPAIELNPFDVAETADAMHRALSMDGEERARRARELRDLVTRRGPGDWLSDQLAMAQG